MSQNVQSTKGLLKFQQLLHRLEHMSLLCNKLLDFYVKILDIS